MRRIARVRGPPSCAANCTRMHSHSHLALAGSRTTPPVHRPSQAPSQARAFSQSPSSRADGGDPGSGPISPLTPKKPGRVTNYFRKALWGTDEPPGPQDPYSQRPSEAAHPTVARRRGRRAAGQADTELDLDTEHDGDGDGAASLLAAAAAADGPLVLPPAETLVAPAADGVTDPSYAPATVARGLPVVGTAPGEWFDSAAEAEKRAGQLNTRVIGVTGLDVDHWAEGVGGAGGGVRWFGSDKVVEGGVDGEEGGGMVDGVRDRWHPAVAECLVRRAVVEALAVKAAGGESVSLVGRWNAGGDGAMDVALKARVEVNEDGSAVLAEGAEGILDGLKDVIIDAEEADFSVASEESGVPQATAEDQVVLAPEQAQEYLSTWDDSWRQISLQDFQFKFAVTKRLVQLTGRLMPDGRLLGVDTVGDLLGVVVRPAREPKLAQVIEDGQLFAGLPNVTVYPTRVTPIDKEKMLGRWKVIEDELARRGLPIVGHEHLPRFKEKAWILHKS